MHAVVPMPVTGPARTAAPADVHYVVTGNGPGTVVLLHGFCDNLTTWKRVVPALAVAHKVIAIDLPGFGGTRRHWQQPLIDGYVDVVAEVLEAEGVDGAVRLIGNSMGAAVATRFAQRYPDLAEALVLIDMPGLHSVPRLWRFALSRPAELGLRAGLWFVPEAATVSGFGWVYSRIAAARPSLLDPTVRSGFTGPYSGRGRVAAIMPIGRTLLRELATLRLGQVVATTAVPTLLVFGSRDVLTPPRVLRRVGRPGGAVVLPRCGHCPQVDQPGALLGEVLPFLRAAGKVAEVG